MINISTKYISPPKEIIYKYCIYSDIKVVLFWIGFASVLCSDTFYTTFFQNIISGGLVYKIGLLCLIAKIGLDVVDKSVCKMPMTWHIIYMLAVIAAFGTFFTTRYLAILSLFLVLVASYQINYKHVTAFFVYIITVSYFINLVLVATGLKGEDLWLDQTIGHDGALRHFIGYWHPNAAMTMTANVFLCLSLYFKEKYRVIICTIMTIIAVVLFYLTDSRSGIIVFFVALVLVLISNTEISKFLLKKNIFIVTYIVSIIVMFGLAIYMNGRRIFNIRFFKTFESRLVYFGKYKDQLSFTFFGKNVADNVRIDCAYFKLIYYFGMIPLIVFIVSYIIAIYRKRDDYYYNILIAAITLIALYATYPLHVFYSLPLLAAFSNHEEEARTDRTFIEAKRYINYAFIFAIPTLLMGHGIIQHGMTVAENNGVIYSGPSNPQVMDCIFLMLGALIGATICYCLQKYTTRKNDI